MQTNEIIPEKLRECIEIKSVKLLKKEARLLVVATSSRFLSINEIKELKSTFSNIVSGAKADVEIDFSAPLLASEADNSQLFKYISETWITLSPVLKHAVLSAEFALDDNGDITARMPSKLAAIALMGGGVRSIDEFIASELHVEKRVKVKADDEMEPVKIDIPEREEMPAAAENRHKRKDKPRGDNAEVLYGSKMSRLKPVPMSEVREDSGTVTVQGAIFDISVKERKDGGAIVLADVTDNTNTLSVKIFLNKNELKLIERLEKVKKSRDYVIVHGRFERDDYLHEYCLFARDILAIDAPKRMDMGEEGKKRVELHLHTQMSTMDALVNVSDAVNTAARWGHRAVAITDHGVVQAFPAAIKAADAVKKSGSDIKVLMGVEGYLLPDCDIIGMDGDFCAISVLSETSGNREYIYELAAKKVYMNGRTEAFCVSIDPGAPMSPELSQRTGIVDIPSDALTLREAILSLFTFIGNTTAVVFDISDTKKLTELAAKFGISPDTHCVSIGMLSHYLHREIKTIGLEQAAAALGMDIRPYCAMEMANALISLKDALTSEMRSRGITTLPLLDSVVRERVKGQRSNFHIIILAKNHDGLLNLYRLVSYSHLEHLKKVPQIPRSLLMMHRDGLILGSACESGELFRAILAGKSDDELDRIASEYDYMEIQPIGNNAFLARNGVVEDDEGLRELNKKVAQIAERQGKMLVATGDVHFLDPEDAIYRKILMHARDFKDAEQQAPLYFKTTDEMLSEFSYLGEEKAFEAVVTNPNAIADMCESMRPFLSEKSTYAPTIDGAEDELRSMTLDRAHEIYGDILPEVVQKRLDKELNSIIGNGYASLYLMAQRLVKKSLSDGYLVGSRGSVGSSFVATMAGITEVNPLQPHYVCPQCKYSDFNIDRKKYACGIDMPVCECPKCGTEMKREGYEIPFEVFLGFKGDKSPDIDLNFSGDYQSVAHKYTETMFGEGYAFRAGTISGIKDKTVFGYVKSYCDSSGMTVSRAEMNRLVQGCTGVKRTTGQHPGGIVIVPKENDIMEFTPIQYPADKQDKNTITTHFDFHALDDRLVKLDILGHDDPTVLRMLQDLTSIDPKTIPQDDEATMKLFSSTESLGITLDELDTDVGSFAIPEFGTTFVRQMLKDTRPTTMEELLRISGLSHGTDVWTGNAQDLVLSGVATLSEVICTRDDIMNYLILHGGDPSLSFKTMESVRKGRGLTPDMEAAMVKNNIPSWFIESCKKIKYMFPRAHAAAYVMMAFRVAYFKVHYPLEFYTVYFTVRADAFDLEKAMGGEKKVLQSIKEIKDKGNNAEEKEKSLLSILEVVFEMNKRGIELLPVDIYRSRANRFVIEDGAIRPPFSSIAGVGANAAELIEQGGAEGEYVSLEDFRRRTRANSAVEKALKTMGCLDGIPESNQISLFG